MTVCPKCGFEQPKDRFCAKCGIQMDSFKVVQPTISQRITSSTFFYGILLATTVTIGTYVVYQSANQNPAEELGSQLEQSVGSTSRSVENPTPAAIESKRANSAAPTNLGDNHQTQATNGLSQSGQPHDSNSPAQLPSSDNQQPPTVNNSLTLASDSKNATESNKSNKKSEIEIQFLKIDQNSAVDFAEEADGKLAMGSASKGVIPNFKGKLERVMRQPGNENLATESRILAMGQTSVIFQGGRDPKGDTVGFFVDVFPIKSTERGLEIKINVRRMLPELSGEEIKVTTTNEDESFVIPTNGAAFVGGLLPRTTVLDPPDSYANVSVLKPLLDQRFRQLGAEFVILIAPSLTDSNPTD